MHQQKLNIKKWIQHGICIGVSILSIGVQAGEGYFGWVYGLDLQPQGKWEFEQRLQLTRGQASGSYDLWQGRTEIEYGLTNNFQIAGYLNSYSINAARNYIKISVTKEEVLVLEDMGCRVVRI